MRLRYTKTIDGVKRTAYAETHECPGVPPVPVALVTVAVLDGLMEAAGWEKES